MEGWVGRTLGFSGVQVSFFLSGNFPHCLSREKAKERPRLLESLAGVETVVFRVLGAVRRVGLFREVVGGGRGKLATCPLLSSLFMSSQPMESGFQGPAESKKKARALRDGFPWSCC